MNIPMTQAVGTSHAQPRMDCENSHRVLRSILSGVAVTQDQIDAYDLPTRPTKETDSRSRNFHGESVEVDALPPSVLRETARIVLLNMLTTMRWSEPGRSKRPNRRRSPGSQNLRPT